MNWEVVVVEYWEEKVDEHLEAFGHLEEDFPMKNSTNVKDLLGLAAKNAAGGGGGGNRIPKYTEAFVSHRRRNIRSTNHEEVVEMVVASSTVVPRKKTLDFFFCRIEGERTVLY